MRVRRLDLLRYGHFTDKSLDLPSRPVDMHIVLGSNEAGKSTVRSALGDLLFGIPARSELNFLHDYGSMRLGAMLEASGEQVEIRRRKGTRNTLLTADDTPLPLGEQALTPFLANANREFFERMFSLDHERLRRGGREILEDRDEVGAVLFSAGSAVQGLQKRLRALDGEADALWSKRRSASRKYYQAQERLKGFESALREHTVSAAKWRELERELADRQSDFDNCQAEVDGLERNLRKISRIRRVARHVTQLGTLEAMIADLGEVASLPDDAESTLEAAAQCILEMNLDLEEHREDLADAKRARADLTWDEDLVLRAEEIRQLHVQRIQLHSERIDLPKRQDELKLEERTLQRLATELEWHSDSVAIISARIPNRTRVEQARSLLGEGTRLHSSVESARRALQGARKRSQDAQRRLAEIGLAADVSNLSAAISEIDGETRDIGFRIREAATDAADAQAESRDRFLALNPRPQSIEAALSITLPSTATVRSFRDRQLDLEQRTRSCEEQIRLARKGVAKDLAARDRMVKSEHPVSESELHARRAERDAGWSLIRRHYLESENVPPMELAAFADGRDSIAAAYEEAVQTADDTADKQFQRAEVTARFSELNRSLEESQRVERELEGDLSKLAQEASDLDSSWRELWTGTSLEPLSPEAMVEWLDIHAQLCTSELTRTKAKRDLAELRRRESGATDRIVSELHSLGIDGSAISGLPLRSLLQRASDIKARHSEVAATRRELASSHRQADDETADASEEVERATAAIEEWRRRWAKTLAKTGMDESLSPEVIGQTLNAIDEMREVAAKVNDLRDKRVGKILRDIGKFEESVRKVVETVAPDLADEDPDNAVIELERRLQTARQSSKEAEDKDREITKLQEKIRDLEAERKQATDAIRRLEERAGVSDTDALREHIEKARLLGEHREALAQALKRIEEDGDGLPIEVLTKDCKGIDPDQAAQQEERLLETAGEARGRLTDARDALREARKSYDDVGGGAAAADAESARQGALTEIGEIAEHYVRARTAASLLRWAVERNRREKQGPLLRAAAKLFGELTSGSFENLEIDFDSQDRARLVGRRPGGERVDVTGMSDGTTDQLYLALRIAALGQYLEAAQPLPFVADDLFINFDDERAAAGFRALGRLAEKCQVIFFTHHVHLAEIARSALGDRASVIDLQEATALSGERLVTALD